MKNISFATGSAAVCSTIVSNTDRDIIFLRSGLSCVGHITQVALQAVERSVRTIFGYSSSIPPGTSIVPVSYHKTTQSLKIDADHLRFLDCCSLGIFRI